MAEAPDKDSRSEQATEKRLKDATEEGNTPVSRETGNVAFLVGSLLAFGYLAPGAVTQLTATLGALLEKSGEIRLNEHNDAINLFLAVVSETFVPLWSFPLLFAAVGVGASIVVHRPVVAWKRVAPQMSRLSPAAGLKRLFGAQGLIEFLKTVLRFMVVAASTLYGVQSMRDRIDVSILMGVGRILETTSGALLSVLTWVAVPYSLLLVLDLPLVKLLWQRSLRMSHDEIKEERKQLEGDPQLKARMRSIARSRLRRRMSADVRKATLVIANPTHFAVALRYVRSEGGAPRVVAKGQDLIALTIRRIAEEEGIPIVEDKALARSLYQKVSVDQMIPVEFYRVIAEVMIKLQKVVPGGGASRVIRQRS